jgi:hypothetical protein
MSWLLFLLLSSPRSFAHANLKVNGNIPPRSADTGLKTAPCGGIARTATNKVLTAGSTVTVEWQETIDHPSRFEFYFSPDGDTGWTLLKTVADTQDGTVPLPHNYSTQLTLPSTPCTACTLQMIQVMLENPASPSYYYSCADIELTSQSVPPSPPASPADPNCH